MRRFATLLVLATVLGCGGDSSTTPSDTVSGTYTLRTVNRSPLPFTVLQQDSLKIEITGDAYTLKDDKTWTEAGTNRTTNAGQVTTDVMSDSGTYVLSGTTITLISAKGSIDGTVGGGSLTLSNSAVVAVYQK